MSGQIKLTEKQKALLLVLCEGVRLIRRFARKHPEAAVVMRDAMSNRPLYQWAESYAGGKRSLRLPWSESAMREKLLAKARREREVKGVHLHHEDRRNRTIKKMEGLNVVTKNAIRHIVEKARAANVMKSEHEQVHGDKPAPGAAAFLIECLFQEQNIVRFERRAKVGNSTSAYRGRKRSKPSTAR